MSTPPVLTSADVRQPPAIVALRTRITDQRAQLLADLERLHEVNDETRPRVHTAEAFEVLEEMDTAAAPSDRRVTRPTRSFFHRALRGTRFAAFFVVGARLA